MKFIKKCPVVILLISIGVLLTIVGATGRRTIYADQEYDPLKNRFYRLFLQQ